jgi:hypothetical protein
VSPRVVLGLLLFLPISRIVLSSIPGENADR